MVEVDNLYLLKGLKNTVDKSIKFEFPISRFKNVRNNKTSSSHNFESKINDNLLKFAGKIAYDEMV